MSKKVNIQFYIKDISTLEFSIKNPPSDSNADSKDIFFEVNPSSTIDVPAKEIDITTFIGIYFDNKKRNEACKLITSIKFGVKNLDEFIDKKDNHLINFPDQFIQTLLSLSLSTSRGILAVKTEGTILRNIYLPILSPSKFKSIERESSKQKNNKRI